MIDRIDLDRFKCFERLKLPIGKLTLLAGTNASGKSSVLQSLVLLHQTIREHEWSSRLHLNGDELSLGTVTDVVDKVSGRREFGIGLVEDDHSIQWTFVGDDRQSMSAAVSSIRLDGDEHPTSSGLRNLVPATAGPAHQKIADRLLRLAYLTAERVGPREMYPLVDIEEVGAVGPRGEFAASVLHSGRDEMVLSELTLRDHPSTRIRQVEARMQQFFPGCSLEISRVPQANGVTLGLRTSDATSFHRPVHVGFGLTQVFPIIVAALSAEAGDLLLIENPEVHLHPAGQSQMGEFLATTASAGVQVVIESHSDHVFNGIRRAVRRATLSPDDVFLHFLQNRDGDGGQVVSPTIDGEGRIDFWPAGFFDQFDRDMNYLAGWSE